MILSESLLLHVSAVFQSLGVKFLILSVMKGII